MNERALALQPKQRALLELLDNPTGPRVVLYGGAMGGAKSEGIRRINLIRRIEHPGTSSLIFRKTIPELRQNHIDPLFKAFPELRAHYNESQRILRFPNGSTTFFGSGEDPGDLAKYWGLEFADEFIDEAQHVPYQAILELRTRNRTTVRDYPCRQVLTANPGGRSHADLKRIFVDRSFYPGEDPTDYAFLQARAPDNVEWVRDLLRREGLTVEEYYRWPEERRLEFFLRSDYGKTLSSLPGKFRDAFLLGRWDVFVGQAFPPDIFQPDRCRASSELGLEPWHPRWISLDWGFAHPSAAYWHARRPDGVVVTYRELVTRETDPEDLARLIVAATRAADERPTAIYAGGDCWARKTDESTIASRMDRVLDQGGLPGLTRAQDGPGSRVGRYRACYDGLAKGKLVVAAGCTELRRVLPSLVIDEDNREDVLKVDGDDAYDGWGYGIYTREEEAEEPREVRVARELASLVKTQRETGGVDMTSVHMRALELEHEDRRRGRGFAFSRRIPTTVR